MKKEEFDDKDTLTENEQAEAAEASTATEKDAAAEDKSSIGADIIRGHINTIILRALYERDKYGYEIMNDIEQKSHNQYSLKQPTLYSALKRLENQGYIIAYWKTDEVSSGGRRKYFTLTDSGREITEKNLAEWEYSRTIIDSLISDRSFDFTQPAPTPVDFTILRNSVSRVPIVHGENEDIQAEEKQTENKENKEEQASEKQSESEEVIIKEQTSSSETSETVTQNVEQKEQVTEQVVEQQTEVKQQEYLQQIEAKQVEQTPAPDASPQQISEEEIAARKLAHENYLRLISEPAANSQPAEDIVPVSENINTNKLLYNVKPSTERDYKNLINGIYEKTIINGRVETNYSQKQSRQATSNRKHSNPSTKIVSRGRADGVRVTPSYEYDARTNYATKTTYNKGLTLLMSSGIVLFILLVEFIFCMIFKDNLKVSVAYPIVILVLGIVQFAVFGILALRGYGANCTKPMSNAYLSKSIIFTIILVLIICVSSFLFNINFTLASDVMKLIVIPIITVLNIIVFTVSFKLLIK